MPNKMNKHEVEKCLYQCITEKKEGNAESLLELKSHFEIISTESINDYEDDVNEILNRLVESRVVSILQRPNGKPYISRAINFNQWVAKMEPQPNNLTIGTLNAGTAQVGNNNTLNVGISAEDFIKILGSFSAKPEPERKSILEQLSSAAQTGASLAESFIKITALMGM